MTRLDLTAFLCNVSGYSADRELLGGSVEAAVSAFLDELFTSENIVKAGFAFNSDLRYLCRSFPHLPCFQERQVRAFVLPITAE